MYTLEQDVFFSRSLQLNTANQGLTDIAFKMSCYADEFSLRVFEKVKGIKLCVRVTTVFANGVSERIGRELSCSYTTHKKLRILNILHFFCVVHICYACTYSIYQLHKKLRIFNILNYCCVLYILISILCHETCKK